MKAVRRKCSRVTTSGTAPTATRTYKLHATASSAPFSYWARNFVYVIFLYKFEYPASFFTDNNISKDSWFKPLESQKAVLETKKNN